MALCRADSGDGHRPHFESGRRGRSRWPPCPVAALLTISTSELSEPVCPSARGQVTPGAHVPCWPHSLSRGRAPREQVGPQRRVQQGGTTHALRRVPHVLTHSPAPPRARTHTHHTHTPGEHTPHMVAHTQSRGVPHPSLSHTHPQQVHPTPTASGTQAGEGEPCPHLTWGIWADAGGLVSRAGSGAGGRAGTRAGTGV